jgi:hypothetical protein
MYAQHHDTLSSSQPAAHRPPVSGTTKNPSRAILQTRPPIQRVCIRSWEYIRPVRITFFVIRLLVVMWLFVLSSILLSSNNAVGWTLIPAAVAVFALSLWVFTTAAKGWPVVDA